MNKGFEIPEIAPWRLVKWTLGITAVIACFWLFIHFEDVILVLLTAVILSTAIRPAVTWLEKRGVPKTTGILLIFILIGLLLGSLLWYSLPTLANQGNAIETSLAEGYRSLHQYLQQLPNVLVRRLLSLLPSELPLLTNEAANLPMPSEETNGVTNADQSNRLLIGIFQFVAIILLTFYWVLEGEHIKQAAFFLIPMSKRGPIRELVNEIENKMSRYLLGQGILCLIIGTLAFVAYLILGLPNALLLAVLAGLLEAVPIVGPFLGAIPAVIVGLSISPVTALWVVLASIVIQQLENSLLVPRIMNRTIGVSPLVTLLALLAFGSLFGVLGALIALPLAAVIQLLLNRYLLGQEGLEDAAVGRDRLSVLRYETKQLVQDIRQQIREKVEVPSALTDVMEDEAEAVALALESYLATVEDKNGASTL